MSASALDVCACTHVASFQKMSVTQHNWCPKRDTTEPIIWEEKNAWLAIGARHATEVDQVERAQLRTEFEHSHPFSC